MGLEEYNGIGTRGQQVKQTEAELFELYKDPNLNYKPEQLTKRGGTHYSQMLHVKLLHQSMLIKILTLL